LGAGMKEFMASRTTPLFHTRSLFD
jgi:hypothetical protein